MATLTFTASTDFTTKGKRLASWHVSQGTGAQTINFRNGGLAGTIIFQVQLVATSSASQPYPKDSMPFFSSGLYVEIVGTGFNAGAVDLV
jgi:hypothetical protein